MNAYQNNSVAEGIYDTLDGMRKEGKNENMLRNAYVKFMCWLYYKFGRIVNQLGEQTVPKILYEGSIGNYELRLLEVLSRVGADILLVQYEGDACYLKLDPTSKHSNAYNADGLMPFPKELSIKRIREELQEKQNVQRLYGAGPEVRNCTNAWITGNVFEDIQTAAEEISKASDVVLNSMNMS